VHPGAAVPTEVHSWCNEGMVPDKGHEAPPAASSPGKEPAWLERVRRIARLDLRPGTPPSNVRLVVATLASVALSLVLNALAVHVATSEFPSTRHFSHFRFDDYGTLTIVGVLFGATGWAGVVRLSSEARWLLLRLAVIVSVVLFLPDVWILVQGESGQGVATLVVMHVLVALVTYNVLVRVAPGTPPTTDHPGAGPEGEPLPLRLSERAVRRIWSGMGLLVALELALGVAVIV
jgi:hypothetical protein